MVAGLTAIILGLLLPVDAVAGECETLWRYIHGKSPDQEYLQSQTARSLLELSRSEPSWDGEEPIRLRWRELPRPVPVRRLGAVGGTRVYEVSYSPLHRVIAWDMGNRSFCPALDVGAEALVEAIHPAKVFKWQGIDVVHVRIQLAGTGHFQESIFLAATGNTLVPLREDAETAARVAAFYEANGIQPYNRGLGFCEGSLIEHQIAEHRRGTPAEGSRKGVVLKYRIDGRRLALDEITFGDVYPFEKTCVVFPGAVQQGNEADKGR